MLFRELRSAGLIVAYVGLFFSLLMFVPWLVSIFTGWEGGSSFFWSGFMTGLFCSLIIIACYGEQPKVTPRFGILVVNLLWFLLPILCAIPLLNSSAELSFTDALFEMELGQISQLVQTSFGYHIIRLDDVRSGEIQTFEEVKDQLSVEYQNEQRESLFYDLALELTGLKSNGYKTNLHFTSIDGGLMRDVSETWNEMKGLTKRQKTMTYDGFSDLFSNYFKEPIGGFKKTIFKSLCERGVNMVIPGGENKSCLLSAIDDESYQYIIMPMRI